jgi:D-3-phosphoglycerate dehydrogenase
MAGKSGKLKVLSKYGIGLDKIDLGAARELGIIVTNCPGVNHTTVAEHVFALLLSYCKHIPEEIGHTREGNWKRITGTEIWGKTMGIVGLGNIGKEVAVRAKAFGMKVLAYDVKPDVSFIKQHQIKHYSSLQRMLPLCDIISLHTPLNESTKSLFNKSLFNFVKKGSILINTARGELVDLDALIENLNTKHLKAYLTDVLEEEPMKRDHPLRNYTNVYITPHIGSRTFESVQRQGILAVNNLIKNLIQND